jgi:hypothetical protein
MDSKTCSAYMRASKHEPATCLMQFSRLCLSCHTIAAGSTGEPNDTFDMTTLADLMS